VKENQFFQSIRFGFEIDFGFHLDYSAAADLWPMIAGIPTALFQISTAAHT
jgi:hypothetical protein